jgi:ribonuclease HII
MSLHNQSKCEADPDEKARLQQLIQFECEARLKGYQCIAGIDEAGRGPLAGPLVAAACIVPPDIFFPGIRDSKLLSPAQRLRLYEYITSCEGVSYGVGIVSEQDIDAINIHQATLKAMAQALEALSPQPDFLLIDGRDFKQFNIPYQAIIKGDNISQSIAAAAIIAKETRDRLMVGYHAQWPEYGFDQHKGYGTVKHLKALQEWGPCPIHRRSFAPVKCSLVSCPLVSCPCP